MKYVLATLYISAALASLAMGAPSNIFNRDPANIVTILSCLPIFIVTGAWSPKCQDAVAIPGLIPLMNVDHITMDFTTVDPWAPLASSNGISVSILKIPGISLPLASGRAHLTIADNDTDIAYIDTSLPVVSMSGGTVTATFSPAPVTIPPNAREAFSTLMADLVGLEAKGFTIKGTVDITFSLGFLLGQRTISNVGFEMVHVFKGLNGMPDVRFVSLTGNTVDAANKKQTLSFKINIKSFSNVTLKLGDFILNAAGPAGPIGTMILKAHTIKSGDNIIDTVMIVDLSLASAADFMQSLDTAGTTLVLTGSDGSTQLAVMKAAARSLRFSTVIPKKFGVA
ncbi:hypothetical protein BGZ59_005693 [Podila verticillata]|nr:hypothetical protein BGZ59_005693 [Podila verticillata]